MAAGPFFANIPFVTNVAIATANTNRDGTGTIGVVHTAPTTTGCAGSLIEKVTICATVQTAAGVIRLYLHDGTNFRLLDEILVSAIVPSATVKVFQQVVTLNMYIPNGSSLRASTHNAENFNVIAQGGYL